MASGVGRREGEEGASDVCNTGMHMLSLGVALDEVQNFIYKQVHRLLSSMLLLILTAAAVTVNVSVRSVSVARLTGRRNSAW